MGVYGHPGNLSPTLDQIAGEGVIFDRVIAASSWTQPSMASLFTSRYPGAHRVIMNLYGLSTEDHQDPAFPILQDTFTTMAETLQSAGYLTGGFVANPLLRKEFGFSQGFDHYDISFAANTTPGDVVNAAAADWLAQRDAEKPFFLYLHYMDVHGPYNAPPAILDPLIEAVDRLPEKHELTLDERHGLTYLDMLPEKHTDPNRHQRLSRYREYWAARYDAGVREIDQHVGDLRVRLQKMGLWDEAYLVITSDHGEALCEHGHWAHGQSAHHPELHVPLFLRWSGVMPVGKRVRQTASLIDVLPTMINQLTIAAPPAIQGQSLLHFIEADDLIESMPVFAEGIVMGPEQRAVYVNQWKMLHNLRTASMSLYDVSKDPLEQTDLAAQQPERIRLFREMMKTQVKINADFAEGIETRVSPVSDEQRERLKALGYTD
jgi:arylsulfatase